MPQNSPTQPAHDYKLSSDLARLSLPQTFLDATRKLAYTNSICLLFLVIGFIGIKPPPITVRDISANADVVPVIFTPPDSPPPPPEPTPEDVKPEDLVDTPEVVTVVAVNNASVAFAVPVEGPVVVASSARFASAPPISRPSGPRATLFDPNGTGDNNCPKPPFPREELNQHHEGKVMLFVIVGDSGWADSVTVKDSSGFAGLDRHAANWVKKNWHGFPGKGAFLVPIDFQITPL